MSSKSSSSIKILPSEHGNRITWWDRYRKGSVYAKTFLFLSTIHSISLMVVGAVSVGWEDIPHIYGFISIYIAFCIWYFMLEGVLKENTVQLMCSILSAVLVTIFLIWSYFRDQSHKIVGALAFSSACFCVLYLAFGGCVCKRFGWYRYNKSQSVNKHTMKIYYVYQKFQSMLLMDGEVCIMFVLLVTFELKHETYIGYIGNISCMIFEVFWVVLGIRSVRVEHRLITQIFMASTVLLIVYIVVICYWIAADTTYSSATTDPQFFVLGTLAFIVRGLTMWWAFKVMNNFDKGLRQYFDKGAHYIDFWGSSNQALLAQNNTNNNNAIGAGRDHTAKNATGTGTGTGTENETPKSAGGMSSRSRIRSDDFD